MGEWQRGEDTMLMATLCTAVVIAVALQETSQKQIKEKKRSKFFQLYKKLTRGRKCKNKSPRDGTTLSTHVMSAQKEISSFKFNHLVKPPRPILPYEPDESMKSAIKKVIHSEENQFDQSLPSILTLAERDTLLDKNSSFVFDIEEIQDEETKNSIIEIPDKAHPLIKVIENTAAAVEEVDWSNELEMPNEGGFVFKENPSSFGFSTSKFFSFDQNMTSSKPTEAKIVNSDVLILDDQFDNLDDLELNDVPEDFDPAKIMKDKFKEDHMDNNNCSMSFSFNKSIGNQINSSSLSENFVDCEEDIVIPEEIKNLALPKRFTEFNTIFHCSLSSDVPAVNEYEDDLEFPEEGLSNNDLTTRKKLEQQNILSDFSPLELVPSLQRMREMNFHSFKETEMHSFGVDIHEECSFTQKEYVFGDGTELDDIDDVITEKKIRVLKPLTKEAVKQRKNGRKNINLIKNINRIQSTQTTVVGEMKFDPIKNEWEGNENILRDFDNVEKSHGNGKQRKPALITKMGPAVVETQGQMVFDPVTQKWIGNEEEIENWDFVQESEPAAAHKHQDVNLTQAEKESCHKCYAYHARESKSFYPTLKESDYENQKALAKKVLQEWKEQETF